MKRASGTNGLSMQMPAGQQRTISSFRTC